ncbi:hypothetical protein A8E91_34205 [Burkholderia cenocepacia]|nr:hypothetical protein A8E88_27040 [Burkholderia cenocepacia]ONW54019.1 hypothetical protein A8E91_34205 [Burkholderia cenocepacia]
MKTLLLIFSRQDRSEDVTKVGRAGSKHGSNCQLSEVVVMACVHRAETFAQRCTHFIPYKRTAKLYQLSGKGEIDADCHLHQ